MILFYILLFIASIFSLGWSGSRLVKYLMKIARFLNWREFVVAFFIMAVAGSFPNLFIGINSALHNIPQLSFGDIVGGNIVDLTLAISAAVLIGGVNLPAKSRLVQRSAIFTAVIAVLPVLLILDKELSRIDGLILILTFLVFIFWLFSKSERFKKIYDKEAELRREKLPFFVKVKEFFKDLTLVFLSLSLLLLGSEGIIISAQVFGNFLQMSLPLVGMLIVGLGNALPETYFAVVSAKKKNNWLILGDLMGAVIVCATLILGIVAIITPIKILNFSTFAIARIFLFISAIFFLIVVRTGQRITKKEGVLLLLIYILFFAGEIIFK